MIRLFAVVSSTSDAPKTFEENEKAKEYFRAQLTASLVSLVL